MGFLLEWIIRDSETGGDKIRTLNLIYQLTSVVRSIFSYYSRRSKNSHMLDYSRLSWVVRISMIVNTVLVTGFLNVECWMLNHCIEIVHCESRSLSWSLGIFKKWLRTQLKVNNGYNDNIIVDLDSLNRAAIFGKIDFFAIQRFLNIFLLPF